MRWGSVALVGLVLATACAGEPVDPVPALTVAVWAGMLEEATGDRYAERRDAIVAALRGSGAEAVCLTNVFRREDHEYLRGRLADVFPHRARVETDASTPVDDLTDRTGATPVPPETAPCEEVRADFETAVGCAADKCAVTPGNLDSTLRGGCMTAACGAELVPLYVAPRCLFCVRNLLGAMDATIREARDQCLRRGNPAHGFGWAFHGQNDLAILSRRPLADVSLYLVGATGMRVGVLHARADDVHLFCTSLSRPYNVAQAECVGPYCEGLPREQGWSRENLLQAEKILAHVRKVAGAEPTILLGNLWASPQTVDGPESAAVATYQRVLAEMEPAVAPGFVASCDRCNENPWNTTPGGKSYWQSHVFHRGLAAVTATQRVFTERTVGDGKFPASKFYGLSTTLHLAR